MAPAKRSGSSSDSRSSQPIPVSAMKSMCPTTRRSTPGAAAMAWTASSPAALQALAHLLACQNAAISSLPSAVFSETMSRLSSRQCR